MKTLNKQTGFIGEKLALDYLLSKNYEPLTKNYSTKFREIDLVMRDGNITVFVEVKTKKGVNFGTPEDMFTHGKYERVKRMATVYLHGRDVPCRIDMVAVTLDSNDQLVSLKHYPNVL